MRREFSTKTKVAAFERCGGRCEECGTKLRPGHIRYDHRIPDWMGGESTLANCRCICDTCDAPKTAQDQTDIAKVKRVRAKHLGAHPRKPQSKFKRRVDGTVVLRNP